MLHVHSSNRVETLAAHLSDLLRKPLAEPLAADVIMVQSHGLERWLSLELAKTLGVSANITFPFPIPFLTEVMLANAPGWDANRTGLLDRDTLTWILMSVLPEVALQEGGEPVAHFLDPKASAPDVRLYQLAEQLGQLLDTYQVYRPQILQRWLSNRIFEEETWQALAWKAVIQRTGAYHRFALKRTFHQQLQTLAPGTLNGLPPRLCLFGISSLAPFFIEILQALAPHTDLHLFFLNPCQEYWGDILSRKQRARLKRGRQGTTPDPWSQMELGLAAEPEFENELLAYFGKTGRDFFDQLVDLEGANQIEDFTEPTGNSALVALQTDILYLQEGQREIDFSAEADFPSLQVHRCHSRMREVEVLNDVLLDIFEKQPSLTPRDIIVMAPQIEEYSSKIHAVFGRSRTDERYLPYDIADRTPLLAHALGSAFLQLLSLTETRWEVSEVLGILECAPIMERFGLTETGLDTLRHWIAESGIRWARDAESKAAFDLPKTHENTWQFGLDRLLLGYAMPCQGRQVFEEVLPFDHVEGSDLEVLSQFLALWDQLKIMQDLLTGLHSASRWAQICRQLVRQFFSDDPSYDRELNVLYELIDSFETTTQHADYSGNVSLSVIRTYYEKHLNETRSSGGFFTGGITFCNLLPMRSIPFRVVILLGMGAKEFPREDRQQTFDLMREKPLRGDRSRKQDDRYLFLEALLSARDRFIVLYTGQSVKDNSELSPSIFISQIHDYLERVYQFPSSTYTFDHRLQPFSPSYFDPSNRLHTFAREYVETPRTVAVEHAQPPVMEALEKVVSVEELTRFLQHPVAAYYRHAFQLHRPSEAIVTSDLEPITLDALDSWQINQWLLELMETETSPETIGRLLTSSGLVPHGTHGASEVQHLVAGVRRFQAAMQPFLGGPPLPTIEIDLKVGDWRIVGKLTNRYQNGLRLVRFGNIRAKDRYELWVKHLVTQSLDSLNHPSSALLGKDQNTFALQPYATSHAALHELRQLLEWRERGLHAPLPLFPNTSMAFARARKQRKDAQESTNAAINVWQGSRFATGEREDYYHHLAFGHVAQPLNNAFIELCEDLVRPILDNEENHVAD